MKNYLYVFLFFQLNCFAQFNSGNDTIVIHTAKQTDSRPYLNHHLEIPERTNNCEKRVFPELKGIPDTLDSVSVFVTTIDLEQAFYQSLKAGIISDQEYIDAVKPAVDTAKCHIRYINTYISVLTGLGRDSVRYYIPETNNNRDFSDEKAYVLNWGFASNDGKILHKILYERFCNDSVILDSTFIRIGIGIRDFPKTPGQINKLRKIKYISMHVNESRSASFSYDNLQYNLVLAPGIGAY